MKKYGLIGHKLGHSFSPLIHSFLGDYEYKLCPLRPEELDGFMRSTELDSFNVTIPYKADVLPYCAALSEMAKTTGSVNTVVRRQDGSLYGDNTDYYGFSFLLGEEKELLIGKKAVVLGSGGASKTVCSVLREAGLSPVVTVSRKGDNNYDNLSAHSDAELIVNATPVGMYPDNGKSPIDLVKFGNCRLVLDLIYNPAKTKLLLQAESLGIPSRNGLAMLVAQAKAASELFQEKKLPDELIARIAETVSRRTKNIALIGMPGCGKSTVGRHLAELAGRRFIDTDELVEEAAGMEIPQLFSMKGQGFFRELETRVLRDVSKYSGAVIATGGGIVTVPDNRELLMQNSTVVLIEYDLGKLDISGRPLSNSVGTEELYRIRKPYYQSWSEYSFYNDSSYETALRIKEELKL